jgi:ribokinase
LIQAAFGNPITVSFHVSGPVRHDHRFGSINIDLVQRTPHFPASGETVLCDSYKLIPGSNGANQALAAARAGASTAMIGMAGRDLFAGMALRDLRRIGVDLTCVGQSKRPTACASVQVADDGENTIVVSSGANLAVTSNQAPDAMFTPDTTVLYTNGSPVNGKLSVPAARPWRCPLHYP